MASKLARLARQALAEEALTRRDVRAAGEMKKFGWANWCGAREHSGIKRRARRPKDPFDDCDGVLR